MSKASPTKEPTHAATTVDTATEDEPLMAEALDDVAGAEEVGFEVTEGVLEVVVTVGVKPDAIGGASV